MNSVAFRIMLQRHLVPGLDMRVWLTLVIKKHQFRVLKMEFHIRAPE